MVNFGQIHTTWAWVVIVSNAIVGCWALAAHWQEGLRVRALWLATAAAHLSITVQVILGVLAMNVNDAEIGQFHMFYGFVALASVGIIFSYRQQVIQWQYLLYGFGGLFLMGLGLRAVFLE